jgi:YD repeat-containing protein
LTKVTNNGEETLYTYDQNSNLTLSTTGNKTTEYTYNKVNSLLTLKNKVGGVEKEAYSYTYYLDGNQASKTDKNGVTSYEYDGLGRLKSEAVGQNVTNYTCDNYSNRQTMQKIGQDAFNVDYNYNKNNQLIKETKNTGDNPNSGEDILDQQIAEQKGVKIPGKTFRGIGLQGEIAFGPAVFGVEIIWFLPDGMPKNGYDFNKPFIYIYTGADFSFNDDTMKAITGQIGNSISNMRKSVSGLSASLSLVTVWGNGNFDEPTDYRGVFKTKTVSVQNYKVSIADSEDGNVTTVNGGVIASTSQFSISNGITHYWQVNQASDDLKWLKSKLSMYNKSSNNPLSRGL